MSPEYFMLAIRIAAALALYGFLAALFVFLRRDLLNSAEHAQVHPSTGLNVLEGAEPLGQRVLEPSNEIGRAADNDIVLDDETVSSHHARILYQGGQWWVEDLASRNGTAVNDIPVEIPMVITYGDQIRMGRVICQLEAIDGETQKPGKEQAQV